MAQKIPINSIIKFTFHSFGPYPSDDEWLDEHDEGRGRIIDYEPHRDEYYVLVTDPSDWVGGDSCGRRLPGPDAKKGCVFKGAALRVIRSSLANTQNKSSVPASNKLSGEALKQYKFFAGKDEGDGRRCPNPNCQAVMKPLGTSYYCPNGCDQKPLQQEGEKDAKL